MSIYTILLIILFFIVLALKPTYFIMGISDEEGEGTLIACTALAVVLFLKFNFSDDVFILSGRQYDRVCEKVMAEAESQDD